MYRGKRITTLAPCYNEQAKISFVIKRLQQISFIDEILIVDDGSTDNSALLSKGLGATVLELGKVLGVGAAIRAGIEYSKPHSDIIVILAGNNKDEPKEISSLLDPLIDGKADFVQGSRYLKGGKTGGDMPNYRKFATRLHPKLMSLFTGRKVTDSTNGFRAFQTSLLNDQKINLNQPWLDQYQLEPYLLYQVLSLGYLYQEVPVSKIYPPKSLGYTKMRPLIDWWGILKPLIYLKFGISH